MNNATEENGSNVIEVSFSSKKEDLSLDLENTTNQWFDDNLENDPLEDLLSEFDECEEEFEDLDKGDYIFHHKNKRDFNLSYKDDSIRMTEVLLKQTEHIQEDLKRLAYYLDEMNIEG